MCHVLLGRMTSFPYQGHVMMQDHTVCGPKDVDSFLWIMLQAM